jgi:hypothetical protein
MFMLRITNNITTSTKAVVILKINATTTAGMITTTMITIITNFSTLQSTRFGGFFIACFFNV